MHAWLESIRMTVNTPPEDGGIDLAGGAAGSKKALSIEEDMDKRRKVMRTGEKEELAKVSEQRDQANVKMEEKKQDETDAIIPR